MVGLSRRHGEKLNRRGFLGALLGLAAVDPERLLWTPGKRLISIPPAPVIIRYRAELIVPEWITREVLRSLKENLRFCWEVNRRYDGSFGRLPRENRLRSNGRR